MLLLCCNTWRNVLLFPSVHLSLTRLRDVGACNFHHRHTFVSVDTVNNCSPPTPFPYKRTACICREETKKPPKNRTCVIAATEQKTSPPTFPSFYLGHIHSPGLDGCHCCQLKQSHNHVCAGISINPPAASSFDCRLKLTAAQFCHPPPCSTSSSLFSLLCPASDPAPSLFLFFFLFVGLNSRPDFPVMTCERVHGSVITNLKLIIWH